MRKLAGLTGVLALLLLWGIAAAHAIGTISTAFDFDPGALTFEKRGEYDVVRIPGGVSTGRPGEPSLPHKSVMVLIPAGARVLSASLISSRVTEVPGKYRLLPTQVPQPLDQSTPQPGFTVPNTVIYGSNSPYPVEQVSLTGQSAMSGYELVSLTVSPLRYIPSEGRLQLATRLEVKITYEEGARPRRHYRRTARGEDFYHDLVRRLVVNPGDISRFAPPFESVLPGPGSEYLVVTSNALKGSFEDLTTWKARRGLSTAIRTTEWIGENYEGRDLQEKIRNYLKVAHEDSGLIWVALGGDVGIVPHRGCYSDCYGTVDAAIPCDLYYSDLDGDWNADGDNLWGELTDEVDLAPDVFVGRLSAADAEGARAIINKVITYEQCLQPGSIPDMLCLAEFLWPGTDAGVLKDTIDSWFMPPEFDPLTKLYASLANLSTSSAVAAMNSGPNLLNHAGHGNYTLMSVGGGVLTNAEMSSLRNAPRFTVLTTYACMSGGFDQNCIGEAFLRNPNGGGFFVGNSRYGWGVVGDPLGGSGPLYDMGFYATLFWDSSYCLGRTLGMSKARYIPDCLSYDSDMRWTMFALNLLGDPETPIWMGVPVDTLEVSFPETLQMGAAQACTVRVQVVDGPVQGIVVSLWKQNEYLSSQTTGTDGRALFAVSTSTPGPLWVTATRANQYLPVVDSITIAPLHGYPVLNECVVQDARAGNGNGRAEPGETADLSITLRNLGLQTATHVEAHLTSPDTDYVTISTGLQTYPEIPSGEVRGPDSPFIIEVEPDCPQGYEATFFVDVSASGFSGSDTFQLLLKSKVILLVDDDGGDGEETYYTQALDSLHCTYDTVGVASLAAQEMGHYPAVIWFTGTDSLTTLTSSERALLTQYLNGQGSLFLSSQNAGEDIGSEPFYAEYLHAAFVSGNAGETYLGGVPGQSIACGDDWQPDTVALMPSHSPSEDRIAPLSGADSLFAYKTGGGSGAIIYDGSDYRLVYLAFPFEAVAGAPVRLQRVELMRRILDWFGVLPTGVQDRPDVLQPLKPPALALMQNSPNPFPGSTLIRFTVPANAKHVRLNVYNLAGQLVRTVLEGKPSPGMVTCTWDGLNSRGASVPSGVYFYRLEADGQHQVRRMTLLR
jgi:hypothetical protein